VSGFADLEVVEGRGRLTLRGDIDILAGDDVRAALARARASHVAAIDVDLALVDFIDSSGLGVLAEAAAELDQVRIVAAPISVIRVFEMSGLGSLLAIDR
jgi:anti-anti-sigma factor